MKRSFTTVGYAIGCVAALLLGVLAFGSPASARVIETEELINFSTGDPATDPGTEGIAIDDDGNLYVRPTSQPAARFGRWLRAPTSQR